MKITDEEIEAIRQEFRSFSMEGDELFLLCDQAKEAYWLAFHLRKVLCQPGAAGSEARAAALSYLRNIGME